MKLTEKQKDLLRTMVDNYCQMCHRPERQVGKLEIHRIKRGNAGGKYYPNNILVICNECHKNLHNGEFK